MQVSEHYLILKLLTSQNSLKCLLFHGKSPNAHINYIFDNTSFVLESKAVEEMSSTPCTSLQFCFNLSSCSANQFFSNFNSLHSARSSTEKQDLEMVYSCWHSSIEHKYAIFTNQQISVEEVKMAHVIFTNPTLTNKYPLKRIALHICAIFNNPTLTNNFLEEQGFAHICNIQL